LAFFSVFFPSFPHPLFSFCISELTFREIDRHTLRASLEATTNIFLTLPFISFERSSGETPRHGLYLVDQVLGELLPSIAFDLPFERIQEIQHARSNDGLLHCAAGVGLGLFEIFIRKVSVPATCDQQNTSAL
jgi:hypothetical protein